jgi:hypothetical protein
MYTADECIHIIITVITEDPTKIIDALDDADMIRAHGADEGMTTHELMAEFMVHAIVQSNPYLADSFNLHAPEIEKAIIAHLVSIQK